MSTLQPRLYALNEKSKRALLIHGVENVSKLEKCLSSFHVGHILRVNFDFVVHTGLHMRLEKDEKRMKVVPTLARQRKDRRS